jgi:Tfp pilus assembly protein PilF
LAILEYKKAAALKPTDPEIHFKIALEYWYLQKLPETAEHYRKVIELKPDHLQAHLNLASVYEHMKQWDDSLKEIAISLQFGKKTGNQQAISPSSSAKKPGTSKPYPLLKINCSF